MANVHHLPSERWPLAPDAWSPLGDNPGRYATHQLLSTFDGGNSVSEDTFSSTQEWPLKNEPLERALEPATLAPLAHGYMSRPSAFSLDASRCDSSFMDWYPKGDATITYHNDNGDVENIPAVDPWILEERCPLLARAFEPSRSGLKLHLEALDSSTAKPFLRYLYTGTYAAPGGASGDNYEDVPTSVLFHCRMYRLGDIYDLADLKQQANVNITRQFEFGCSSPDKPMELCSAIQYAYQHLRDHAALLETIICYCVTCFLHHRLAEDDNFRNMAYTLRPFHQDLCKESMKRQFEDDTAAAIIQLPFQPYSPAEYASREDLGVRFRRDVVHHFHASDVYDDVVAKKRKRQEAIQPAGASTLLLALRLNRKSRVQDQPDVEADPQAGSKKRSPVSRANIELGDASSESEYEVVSGPSPVECLSSEGESDVEDVVVVEQPSAESEVEEDSHCLPIRNRKAPITSNPAVDNAFEEFGVGSDSEWSVI